MKRSKSVGDMTKEPQNYRKNLLEFCEGTSIHGIKYIMERQRSYLERSLWLVAVLGALAAFLFLFCKALERYQASPVIVAKDKSQRFVWDIPFPAVTICPMTKINATLFNYTDVIVRYRTLGPLATVSAEEIDILQDLTLQCDYYMYSSNYYRNSSTIDRIEKFALNVDETVDCEYFDYYKPNAFKKMLTEEGICFSFNMLPRELLFPEDTFHATRDYLNYEDVNVRWNILNGYHPKAGLDAYPNRGVGAGKSAALKVDISVLHIDYLCQQMHQGFKVALHGVADFPQLDFVHSFLVPFESVTHVTVFPSEILADASMRERFTIEQRQCYFPGERPLRFFLQYTQSNCRLECLANFTLKKCGCVPFYMPRELETQICTYFKIFCSLDAEQELEQLETGLLNSSESTCSCLQSCVYVQYDSQRSQTRRDREKVLKLLRRNVTSVNGAVIYISFKNTDYVPQRRTELYTLNDMIANCGGLLGLCLGMSVLSIVELFYWLLLRSWWHPRGVRISPPAPRIVYPHVTFFQNYYQN